jgi:hypothetical protein
VQFGLSTFAPRPDRFPVYPPAITLLLTAWTIVLVPVYWHQYGPQNFLWFSDIALFALVIAAWTGSRLLPSMMAVGVLPMETVWLVDFLTVGSLTGVAAYMFDSQNPLYLRGLSLFHLMLPPLIVWMLACRGYDRRALAFQWALAYAVLIATYLLTDPQQNINAAFGIASRQYQIHPLLYLSLYMAVLPLVVLLPMHWILTRLFGERGKLRLSPELSHS